MIGLTNSAIQNLSRFLGRRAPAAKKSSMDELEPSTAKVLDFIFAEEFEELPAVFDARKLHKRS